MAQQAVAFAQNKGTLATGQAISVNKYNVQVERYLSQGGFAHVYLVRTPTPVYGTTHHVLKRIAVPNEAMLSEVKKEVDIMRLLKGHPNIVHLIDAAWHRMANGQYEVFILMEFCPGGGIIDMMNRRLRERLTEAEILQIFVDVCEGVAYMHNMRPPLLHRDLKVENILQSSSTSFKLCDFGSATSVAPRPPSSTQEIRALEADLNRHTTLQYRAPEMVDPYLRRLVDEKSDVWALGVLLYKLCYYTTPFEEHGPLAILNVQYRIPPYPVYSAQMNALIASMLREHGAQRPSVFELLQITHGLRGTKSPYHYKIPAPQPLTPVHAQPQAQSKSQLQAPIHHVRPHSQPTLLPQPSPPKNGGHQARDKVLEAIAPMRRGRPVISKEPPSSERSILPLEPLDKPTLPALQKKQSPDLNGKNRDWFGDGLNVDEDKAWKAVTQAEAAQDSGRLDSAWNVGAKNPNPSKPSAGTQGFGDDFGQRLWSQFESPPELGSKPPQPPVAGGASNLRRAGSSSTRVLATPISAAGNANPSKILPARQIGSGFKPKDAFDGLGITDQKMQPTLGEARMIRTGLASFNSSQKLPTQSSLAPQPQPSFKPRSPPPTGPQLQSKNVSQSLTPEPAWRQQQLLTSRPSSSSQPLPDDLPAESRFPSLEELDSTFGKTPDLKLGQDLKGSSRITPNPSGQSSLAKPKFGLTEPVPPRLPPRKNSTTGYGMTGDYLTPNVPLKPAHGEVAKPEQFSGAASREPRASSDRRMAEPSPSSSTLKPGFSARPSLTRRHRSSVTVRRDSQRPDALLSTSNLPNKALETKPSPRLEPKDWLTGDDDDFESPPIAATTRPSSNVVEAPAARGSPGKRASYLGNPVKNHVPISTNNYRARSPSPFRPERPPSPSSLTKPKQVQRVGSLSRANRVFPSLDIGTTAADLAKDIPDSLKENWSPEVEGAASQEGLQRSSSVSSPDEGPEDANGSVCPSNLEGDAGRSKPKRKGRQSSVHDLVDLWGGGVGKEKETSRPSSALAGATGVLATKRSGGASHPPPAPSANSNINSKRASPDSSKRLGRSPSANLSSSSGRSRPQSMFIFPPTKAAVDNQFGASSAALSPPVDANAPQRQRRTSISDMVQHYEAIGGNKVAVASGSLSTPTIYSKPTGLKVGTSRASSPANGRFPRPRVQSTSSPVTTIPAYTSSTRAADPKDPLKPAASRRPPSRPQTEKPGLAADSRPIRSSSPQKQPALDVNSTALKGPSFASRKAVPSHDESSEQGEMRSPSPERPYRGVGKLIDQWQKKVTETQPVKAGSRGRGIPRRIEAD